MKGSFVSASTVEASRLGSETFPGCSVAAGVEAETAPASSMAYAFAPESSCIGIGLASETVTATLSRS